MNKYSAFLIGLICILFACNKDSGEAESPDVSGFWIMTENILGNCGGDDYTELETVIVEIGQSGNNLTYITYPEGDILQGTITGNTITMEGEFTGGSGNNVISFSGTVGSNGNTLTGTAEWEWYSNTDNCSGTATVTGEKAADTDVNYSGIWEGTWTSDEYSMSGTFSVGVTQTGNILSGTIDVPEISLSDAVLQGEVHGRIVSFGDIDGIIKFAGTANNSSSSGNYTYPDFYDEGTWEAIKNIK